MTEHHFETPHPVHLYAELGKGSITVTAAPTSQSHVALDGPDADSVVVTQDGDQISVVAPRQRTGFFGGESALEVTVALPEHSDLRIRTGSADITARGPMASCVLKSGSGDVELEQCGGPSQVETGSGDVTVGVAGAELRIKSGSGDVRITHAESASSVSTGSGDVHYETAGGPVSVKTGSGDLTVDDARDDLALSTASGDLLVGTARRGRLTAKGASGDVVIGIPAGVPVWTDIATLSGDIRSTLAGAGQPAEGADHLEVRAKTLSGDVLLRQV